MPRAWTVELPGLPRGQSVPPLELSRSAPGTPTVQAWVASEAPTAARSPVVTGAQVEPAPALPLRVCTIVPRSPAAQPRSALPRPTPFRLAVDEVVWPVQAVAPPSRVRRMTPPAPTAKPSVALRKATPVRLAVVPLVWTVQVPGTAGGPAAASRRQRAIPKRLIIPSLVPVARGSPPEPRGRILDGLEGRCQENGR